MANINVGPDPHLTYENTKDLVRFAKDCWMSGVVQSKPHPTFPPYMWQVGQYMSTVEGVAPAQNVQTSPALRTKVSRFAPRFPFCRSVVPSITAPWLSGSGNNAPFPPFLQLVALKTFPLGAVGVIPGGPIEGLLRVFGQFTLTLPTG